MFSLVPTAIPLVYKTFGCLGKPELAPSSERFATAQEKARPGSSMVPAGLGISSKIRHSKLSTRHESVYIRPETAHRRQAVLYFQPSFM